MDHKPWMSGIDLLKWIINLGRKNNARLKDTVCGNALAYGNAKVSGQIAVQSEVQRIIAEAQNKLVDLEREIESIEGVLKDMEQSLDDHIAEVKIIIDTLQALRDQQ